MAEILTIYSLWFLFLCLIPVIILFARTAITPDMVKLDGLKLVPRYLVLRDSGALANVISVDNNFGEFVQKQTGIKKNKAVLKILAAMCDDAKNGIKHNPETYLCKYKHTLDRFFGCVLVSSFIPLIVAAWKYDALHPTTGLMLHNLAFLQLVGFAIVLAVHRLLRYKYEVFYDIFYTHWYDKILNFDIIVINRLRPYIFNTVKSAQENSLVSAAAKISVTGEYYADALLQTAKGAAAKLDEFLALQQANAGINPQNTVALFDEIVSKTAALNDALTQACEKTEDSFKHLSSIVKNNKTGIKAVNKNTARLLELKESLAAYKDEAASAEIFHLTQTTEFFKKNVVRTFEAVEASVKQNAENLSAAYTAFFELVKKFKSKLDEQSDTATGQLTQSEHDIFQKNMNELEKVIVELSAASAEISNQAEGLDGVVS